VCSSDLITPNLFASSLDYELLVSGSVDLKYQNHTFLGADIELRVEPDGVSVVSFTPRGGAILPEINLSWLKIAFQNFSLNSLNHAGGSWDFNFGTDVTFSFPGLNGFTLPQMNGSSFSKNGFNIPAISLENLSLPKITIGSFEFEFNALRILPLTINWPDFGSGSSGNFGFNFDLNVRMPNLPGGSPDLWNLVIPVMNASLSNGNFSIPFPDLNFELPGLELDLNGSLPFFITGLKGSLNIGLAGGLNINPDLQIKGRLSLPSTFNCQGTNSYIELLSQTVNLSSDGKLSAIIENVIPNCPLEIGLLKITITSSKLILSNEGNKQQAFLEGNGNIILNSPGGQSITAAVTFKYDLINQSLIQFSAQINQPFVLNFPPENPVLSFIINSATITQDELIIDGRHQIRLADRTNIGATFNSFKLNWQNYAINSGNVTFDIPFALKAVIENNEINFSSVAAGTTLSESTGLLLNLPNSIGIGLNGFTISGNSTAHLKYEGRDLQNLSAVFSNDFAISLNLFKVTKGQSEILSGEVHIALINASGFFPDLNQLAESILPEKLPLPIESIAYLKIKEGRSLLIEQAIENT